MLALFSLGSTEGADVIAYNPNTIGNYMAMVIIVVMGMFILAFINAKGNKSTYSFLMTCILGDEFIQFDKLIPFVAILLIHCIHPQYVCCIGKTE